MRILHVSAVIQRTGPDPAGPSSRGVVSVEKWKKVWNTFVVVFKGTYRYRVDPKGRVPIPPPFRRALGKEPMVLTRLDECLAGYPAQRWVDLETQLLSLPSFSKSVKTLTRVLASHAVDCPLDAQGRILVPAALRKSVGIAGEAVVVGVLDRFEIWSPDGWDRFLVDSDRLLEDVSVDVAWPTPTSSRSTASDAAAEGPLPQAKPKE